MVLILFCMLARLAFLGIVFTENQTKQFKYGEWTGELPVIFKFALGLYVCKYKVHVYYATKQQKAPLWVRPTILCFEILAVVLPASIPIVACSDLSQTAYIAYVLSIQMFFSVGIMGFSLALTYPLSRLLEFGYYNKIRKWLCILELFIQMMLFGRILMLLSAYLLQENPVMFQVCFTFILIFTEILPFVCLVVDMIKRLRVKS